MNARHTLALLALLVLPALAACEAEPGAPVYNGYVEGQYVMLAPREAGRIASMDLERGMRVSAGDVVFALETDDAEAALAAAEAELARAEAQLADLTHGTRPAEIAVTRAQLEEARAGLVDAQRRFTRQSELLKKGHTSQAAYDQAKAAADQAAARAESLQRQIAVQEMAAREQQIEAARSAVAAQQAQVRQAKWRLAERSVRAPASGTIEEVLRRKGEMSAPDAPAATLLPEGGRVVRFFVPEAVRARVTPGTAVTLSCNGCAPGLEAEVSFVSTEAEYTPPVIYSVESRQKLVFMVEAKPAGAASGLAPGQIVDVRIAGETDQ